MRAVYGIWFLSLSSCAPNSRVPVAHVQAPASPAALAVPAPATKLGSLIEHEASIAVEQPGPHSGGGTTTAYPFFAAAPKLGLVFRKRVLHPGSAIGLHPHGKDEIYYVLSGQGELTLDGRKELVSAGTAILTRDGSTHGLRQVGEADLVIIINYQQPIESQPALVTSQPSPVEPQSIEPRAKP